MKTKSFVTLLTVTVGFAWLLAACGSATSSSTPLASTSTPISQPQSYAAFCGEQPVPAGSGKVDMGLKCQTTNNVYIVEVMVTNSAVSNVTVQDCTLDHMVNLPSGDVWLFKAKQNGNNVIVYWSKDKQKVQLYESPPGGSTTIPLS